MNAQHTPTPWCQVPEKLGSIEDASGHNVAQAQQRIGDSLHHERLANAAFIVRACNAHEDLIAALAEAVDVVDKCGFGGSNAAREKTFLKRARAALNKAGA